jgi:hypothetical protein
MIVSMVPQTPRIDNSVRGLERVPIHSSHGLPGVSRAICVQPWTELSGEYAAQSTTYAETWPSEFIPCELLHPVYFVFTVLGQKSELMAGFTPKPVIFDLKYFGTMTFDHVQI